MANLEHILNLIKLERQAQDKKWGQQDHPNGTGKVFQQLNAAAARQECDRAFANKKGTWAHILNEEFAEALAESDHDRLIEELVQVAAVSVSWIEAIYRQKDFINKKND